MRPDERELDDEIRGHLALSVKERIERGEDPEAARLAALREFGYLPAVRDSMRRVWYSRWFDAAVALGHDIRIAFRSLRRAKGMAVAVVVTLALGVGANAAIFSVVRGVLLRPLVNRGEDRLIYLGQSAPGVGIANTMFSMAEIGDFKARATTVGSFGDFSTISFTMLGFGEPRVVQAGVVGGSFFDVMGLRPVLGRLLNASDDGPKAAGAAVLTHRFWTTSLNSDPAVIGKTIGLGPRTATVVGVLEPSVPYPADTEIIANMVTSPHHLGATMVTERTHRMTELFGRLAPAATVEDARSELTAIHAAMMRENPEAYSTRADMRLSVAPLRDQITAPARTILLVLLASASIVFIIACSNVANLILARSVRREGELAVRAALGASHGALRRTLLAESLVLCGAGAVLGVLMAAPFVSLVARFAARFSVRALDVTVDSSVLWVGAGLSMAAAVALAYIPRLPSPHASAGLGLASGSLRLTPGTNRRLRAFAMTQIAFTFVLLAGAATLVATLVALQTAATGLNLRQVLAIDLPSPTLGVSNPQEMTFYEEASRRVAQLPGVTGVALGSFVPWRDAGRTMTFPFTVDGYTPADGEPDPYARFRIVAPGFFAVLGVPLVAGRDFTDQDRRGGDAVVIVSESIARRLFPNGDALNRDMWWTDPMWPTRVPRRIVGVVADVDDEHVVPGPTLTVYHPVQQIGVAGRMFVHAAAGSDPYALVPSVTRVVREMSANQPVERAATLEDVRADVLAPERLNAFVLAGFAGVALLIAAVGVAGVLAFSVSARTREFGVRLAVGSSPRHLLVGVLREGVTIVALGVVAGAVGGIAFASLAESYIGAVNLPGALPLVAAAVVLVSAAVVASLMPAARASRVDVLQALRSESLMNAEYATRPLRLWPGVTLVVLQWVFWIIVPMVPLFGPEAGFVGMIGGALCGLLLLVWWLFLSRAPWLDRFGAVAFAVVALILTKRVVHPSIAGGAMGFLIYVYGMPVMCVAVVAGAAAGRTLSANGRRVALALAILLGCGVFLLLRTDGMYGSDSQFAWRWTKTAEERLLAEVRDEPAPVPPPAVAAPAADPTPVEPAPGKVDEKPAAERPDDRADGESFRLKAEATNARVEAPALSERSDPRAEGPAVWPGFRGPDRDGVVSGVRIATDWSTSPPVELWRRPIGPGWSSFAVQGDLFYTQEQRGEDEIVSAYRLSTGAPVWRHRDAVRFYESNAGPGPRGTPTIHQGRVYAFGATGILNALDARTGALAWSRDVAQETGRAIPDWGFSSSPLVIDDEVIVAASGTLAAYDTATGASRWIGPRQHGSYSSPHRATIDGVTQVLLLSGSGAASVAPADGTLLWAHDWSEGGTTIVQPAVLAGNDILINGIAATGGLGLRRLAVTHGATGWTASERWTSNGLKPYFNDFVVHKGHAYGFDGSILSCIALDDGARKWKGGRYGNGQLVLLADQDLLLVISEDGELAIVSATPDRYRELSRATALHNKTWNHPAVVGDVLLVRNGEEMAAFRLPAAKP